MGANKISFNKGDYCRTTQDNIPYECRVLEINESKTKVEMIGLGINIEVETKSLLPSLGKTARTKQEEDAQIVAALKAGDFCRAIREDKLTEAKIWDWAEDETGKRYAVIAFVDAPDLESTVWIEELKPQWKVGDYCRAKWSTDDVIYESQIRELGSSDGQRYAVVEFLGYGNQDSQWICDLMESQGDKPRQVQIAEALGSTVEETKIWKDRDPCRVTVKEGEYEGTIKLISQDGTVKVHIIGHGKDYDVQKSELKPSAGKEARAKQRAEAAEKEEQAKGKDAKETFCEVVVGMYCRGVFKEDGLEYEGIVKSIGSTDDGQYAVVEFVGYGNEESIWYQDLLKSHGEKARLKQSKEALGEQVDTNESEKTTSVWKIGMFCRGVYQADGLQYEGVLQSIESSEDGQYCSVQFIGYGNEETIWLQDILESKGEEARKKQTKEALGEQAVIAEPAPEIQTQEDEVENKTKENASQENQAWKIGMFCRAIFQQDGLEYEGTVESIENSEDGKYSVVKFVGYGNEETVWVKDLLESKGEESRKKQSKEALGETATNEEVLPKIEPADTSKDIKSITWKLGMFCRAIFQEDGLEYEGSIESIADSSDGQYAVVKFLGYGNEVTVWVRDLLESKGEEVRKQQNKEAGVETSVDESDTKVEAEDYLKKTAGWKVGMFCRAIYKEDGLEYEGIVQSVAKSEAGMYAVIKFVGYGNEETVWLPDIMETKGEAIREKQIQEATDEPAIDVQNPTSEAMPEESIKKFDAADWKVGMFCSGIFQDGHEYEGIVKSIEISDEAPYLLVEIIGQDKQETIWLQDVKKSKGEEARQKQFKEAKGTTDVKETTATLSQIISEVKVKNGQKIDDSPKKDSVIANTQQTEVATWQAGMFCRGIFQADGLEYEGLIKTIESSENGQYATIQFIGYDDEETVWLQNLIESKGEEARQKQAKESKGSIAINGQETKRKWKIGDHCRAWYAETEEECESIIEELDIDENNEEYATIRIIGFGTAHCVWPKDLKESQGKEARDKQVKVALKDINSGNEAVQKLNSSANTSGSSDRKTVIEGEVKKEWKMDDYCRVLCKFNKQEREVEAQIIKQHPKDPNIFRYKVLGHDDKTASVHKDELKESLGETARRSQIEAAVKKEVVYPMKNEVLVNGKVFNPNTRETVLIPKQSLTGSGTHGLINGDANNNYPSGVNWQQKYEEQAAKMEEMTRVNRVLMNTLNNLEQEIQMYGQVIGELKSLMKATLQESPIIEPGNGLVNGHI